MAIADLLHSISSPIRTSGGTGRLPRLADRVKHGKAAPSGGTRRRFHMIRAARAPAALSLNTKSDSKRRTLGSGYPA